MAEVIIDNRGRDTRDMTAQLAAANERIEALTEFAEWIVASHEEGEGIAATQNAIANIYLRARAALADPAMAGEIRTVLGEGIEVLRAGRVEGFPTDPPRPPVPTH